MPARTYRFKSIRMTHIALASLAGARVGSVYVVGREVLCCPEGLVKETFRCSQSTSEQIPSVCERFCLCQPISVSRGRCAESSTSMEDS